MRWGLLCISCNEKQSGVELRIAASHLCTAVFSFMKNCYCELASFPGLPRFVLWFAFSIIHSASVYYTKRKPMNINGGGLGARLTVSSYSMTEIWASFQCVNCLRGQLWDLYWIRPRPLVRKAAFSFLYWLYPIWLYNVFVLHHEGCPLLWPLFIQWTMAVCYISEASACATNCETLYRGP